MSSTGTVFQTRASVSEFGESSRRTESDIGAAPGIEGTPHRTSGTVNKVHDTKPRLVKANDEDGSPLANGRWIHLDHSAGEIAERWGTVRVGFKVRVTSTGPAGGSADAKVIGAENEDVEESHVPNDAATGLWAIFHGHFA